MSTFKARTTKPEAGNKYYIRKANGGYSYAIKGSPADKDCDVLSNCVGYAYGRFNEIGGWGSCKYLSPVNAENFIQCKGSCEVGQTPKLGACMVWQKGATLKNSDGAGHVAIVEKVISDTEVVTSESAWGGAAFYTKTRKKGTGAWGMGIGYKFLGFIYNPAPCCNTVTPKPSTPTATATKALKVGDVVDFKGTKHYVNATALIGSKCKAGKAKITALAPGKKHPYHLVRVDGGGSTVWGWVDAADIPAATTTATATPKPTAPAVQKEIKVGDIVNFTGSKHYTNATAASGKTCKPGKAKVTVMAPGKKHPYHLVRVSGGGSTVWGWVDAADISR